LIILNETISNKLPSTFKLYFLKDINSTQIDYRLKLRLRLIEELKKQNQKIDSNLLIDLKIRPQTDFSNISLSHSQKASAIATIENKYLIGVDCEFNERLNDQIINRISTNKELKSVTKNPHLIFSAKESAWKALNHTYNLSIISQIETVDWQIRSNAWSEFKVAIDGQIVDGHGFVYEFSDTYLSFYFSPSTFI
jgi:hypothetical protein